MIGSTVSCGIFFLQILSGLRNIGSTTYTHSIHIRRLLLLKKPSTAITSVIVIVAKYSHQNYKHYGYRCELYESVTDIIMNVIMATNCNF